MDRPDDPGGRTNFGITQRAWDVWRTNQAPAAPADVADLTADSPYIAPFYESGYWSPCGSDALDQGPALAVFDTAVNLGVQRTLALWYASQQNVEEFLWARLAHYSSLTHLSQFLGGWLRRVLLLREAIHQGGST